MELDWRNRCVGGERLEDLYNVVLDFGAPDVVDDLYDLIWDEPGLALPFHRAVLRVQAELLWKHASRLRAADVASMEETRLARDAFVEVLVRAGFELERSGLLAEAGD